jgi:hypothetical protein
MILDSLQGMVYKKMTILTLSPFTIVSTAIIFFTAKHVSHGISKKA